MKKTNFFKLFLVGAIALTVGLAGCQNSVSEKDFEKACERITALENSLSDIDAQIKAMKYVVSVTKSGNNYIVKNNEGAELTIVVGDGEGGSAWMYVDETTGNWFIDGDNTGEKAIETTPRIQLVDDVPYWFFPVVKDGDIAWVQGKEAVAAAYAIEDKINGGWELYLPTKDGKKLQGPITIAGADADIKKIDILGWIVGKGQEGENISMYDFDAAGFTVDKDGVIKHDSGLNVNTGTDDSTTEPGSGGVPTGATGTGAGHSGVDLISGDKTFAVNFFYIERFPLDMNYTYVPSDEANDPRTDDVTAELGNTDTSTFPYGFIDGSGFGTEWKGGRMHVEKYNVLNTLEAERKGLLVQVHPLTAKLDKVTFTAENSKGGLLPVDWGTPELITGLLTRAAGDSALYFVPGKSTKVTYPSTKSVYTNKYVTDALYTLVTPSGLRSEYTPFTFVANQVQSLEAPVNWIISTNDKADDVVPNQKDALWKLDADASSAPFKGAYPYGGNRVSAVLPINTQIDYIIETNEWYRPEWDKTDDLANLNKATPTTNAVIDWSMRLIDDTSAYDAYEEDHPGESITVQYLEGQFGLKFNEERTAFQVTRLPDNLTLACFDLEVRKLGVDGVVYIEYVRIRPVRDGLTTPIDMKEYKIIDKNFTQSLTDAAGPAEYYWNSTSNGAIERYLSGSMIVPLTKMFDALKEIPDGGHTNLAQRWKHSQYGAKDYSIRSLTITDPEGEVVVINGPYGGNTNDPASDLYKVMTNTESAVIAGGNVGTDYSAKRNAFGRVAGTGGNMEGSIIYGYKSLTPARATASANSTDWTANVNEWESIVFQPQYSVDGVQPLFDVNSVYEMTMDFYDEEGDYLNTIVIKFKPIIPVNSLIQKDPIFWNSGTNPSGSFKDGANKWNDGKTDVLNAFYKNPASWAEGMAPNGTRYDIALGAYNTVTSNGNGGDGGFFKFGTADHSQEEWAKLSYTLTYGKNPNAVPGTTVADWNAYNAGIPAPASGAPYVIYPWNASSPIYPLNGMPTYGTDLYPYDGTSGFAYPLAAGLQAPANATANDMTFNVQNQYVVRSEVADQVDYDGDGDMTNTAVWVSNDRFQDGWTPAQRVAAGNYYGEIMHMSLSGANAAKYLDVYNFDATDAEFNIRIMSALYEGWIEATNNEVVIPAASGGIWAEVNKSMIWGKTYNGLGIDEDDRTKYEVFKEWINGAPQYRYTYIDRVEFEVPKDQNGNYVNYYRFLNDVVPAPTTPGAATTYQSFIGVASLPTASTASVLKIDSGNLSSPTETTIVVKVYDRFGKIKTKELPLIITVNGQRP